MGLCGAAEAQLSRYVTSQQHAATLFEIAHRGRAREWFCASTHIGYLTKHAIVPKQIGCIRHPTPQGTYDAHHRRSEAPRDFTFLPRRHFWPRAARRVGAHPPKLIATSA